MKYGLLKQTHPDYHGRAWSELDDFFAGGYRMEERAGAYLPKLVGESHERYKERLQTASYIGYVGRILNRFVANVFARNLVVTPDEKEAGAWDSVFYELFAADADRLKTPFALMMRKALLMSLLKGNHGIGIDTPSPEQLGVDAPFATRAEEDSAGAARAYLYDVPVESMLDWKREDDGSYRWLVLWRTIQERESPLDSRDLVIEEFKIWAMHGGTATWTTYRTKPYKQGETPNDTDDLILHAQGVTTFPRIPILTFDLPPDLWIGNHIGPIQKEHFRRRSTLVSSQNRSLYAVPLIRLGSEGPEVGGPIPAEVQMDPNRAVDPRAALAQKGYLVLGKDDDLTFPEPGGSSYSLAYQQIRDLIDEMHLIVDQMAASIQATSTALGRSGESKRADRSSFEIVLSDLGERARQYALRVYGGVAEIRDERVGWTVHGCDEFDVDDRAGLVTEAGRLDTVNIPSPTFKRTYKTRIALKLVPDADPATKQAIREEIHAGITAEGDMDALLRDTDKPPAIQ